MPKVKFEFDPFKIAGITEKEARGKKTEILREVKEFVKDAIIARSLDHKPSASNGLWRPLSKEYKKKTGKSKADLWLTGKLLPSIQVKRGDELPLQVTVPESQQGKADGHTNHSRNGSDSRRRDFIPDQTKGQDFARPILTEIRRIVLSKVKE